MNIKLFDSGYLNFVEFNVTGDNDNYNRCDQESMYLDAGVFNIFQNCFENANRTFDYFGGTRYNSRTIIVLRNELNSCLERFRGISTLNDFITLLEGSFMGSSFIKDISDSDNLWQQKWEEYLKQLTVVLEDLAGLAERCAFEERVLWVIGY